MIANATREIVRRSQIHKAAYNPRKISEAARNKLATSMHEFGLVIPLVWNRQTGNLVGGHQRLDILDAENMPHGGDYEIEVSVVDLTLEREKVLNVALNKIGGEFDDDKLQSLLDELDGKLDLDLTSLIIDEEKKERKKREKAEKTKPVDATFEVVIKCTDEDEQKLLYERLTEEGYECRLLVL